MSCLFVISCSSKVQTSFNCEPEYYAKDIINQPVRGKQLEIEIVPSAAAKWPDLGAPEQQVQEVTRDQTIEWRFGKFSEECSRSRNCGIVFKKVNAQATLKKTRAISCQPQAGGAYSCKLDASKLFELCGKKETICAFSYTINVAEHYRDPVIIVRPPQ
jgi:hypothetical protein